MSETTDRTWPLPNHPWVMRMVWSDLLFAHWPVDPGTVGPLLPPALSLDTFRGKAWIGVVPFQMSRVAPRCCPPLPKLSNFLELNVRTYVTLEGKPGVWFFSLDAESRVAVRAARATFNLPYMDAHMSMSICKSGSIDYQSKRTHRGEPPAAFDATYAANGDMFTAQPGSLEYWLTARYCLYCTNRSGRLLRGEIDHPPWLLAAATCTIRRNTMAEPLGLQLRGSPHLLCAAPIEVQAWLATRCASDA